MLAIAGQRDKPNWLNFFKEPMDPRSLGVIGGKKLISIFLSKFEIISEVFSKFNRQHQALQLQLNIKLIHLIFKQSQK